MSIISRRSLLSWTALASVTSVLPSIAQGTISAKAASTRTLDEPVRLNFNESPFGPSDGALQAMRLGAEKSGRYHYGEQLKLIDLFAEQHKIPAEYVHAYSGSREAIQHAISAFAAGRSLVMATPSYDSVAEAARNKIIKVHEVPLDKNDAHAISAMLTADPNAGLLYICNPNNPTGTLTSRQDIEWAAKNKPRGTILLIDEAYIHFSDAPECLDLAVNRNDVLVLRTFSKLYGMAGARLGLAIGHPDLLQRMELFGGENFVPMPAAMGAIASLEDRDLIALRKQTNFRIRDQIVNTLRQKGLACTDSQANCFMIDTTRPAQEIIQAMEKKKILIGRSWQDRPTSVRVSVGSAEEMHLFQTAFINVMEQLGVLKTS